MPAEAKYILTYSGRWINPLDPDPDAIVIEDIAHHLAQLCRFTGAVREFYSVAQHSIIVSELVGNLNEDLMLWGLLHDAAEAYMGDIARPVKYQPGYGYQYRKVVKPLERAVWDKFGLEGDEPDEVKVMDQVAVHTEQRDLMPEPIEPHPDNAYDRDSYAGELIPYFIKGWQPDDAEYFFLRKYHSLVGG